MYNTDAKAYIGTLSNERGVYSGSFSMKTAPKSITVKSSNGGSATKTVTTT